MNCSLCSSAGEMPLPARKGEGEENKKAISWESWGQLIWAVAALGSQALPTSAAGCAGRPPGPLGMEEPLAGSPVAPKSLEVAGACRLFL